MRKDGSFALIVLIWIAFAWRIHALTQQSLWRDEVDAIYFALRPLTETVSMIWQTAQNGPLYFLSLRPWFRIVGSSEFALRLPSVMAGTVSVVLIFQVARLLLGPYTAEPNQPQPNRSQKTARGSTLYQAIYQALKPYTVPLLAALFMTLNPYQLWYGQEGKMYAVIVSLALLASWFWLQGIQHKKWRYWIGYLITTSIAMYSHLLMVLMIPMHFVWFFIAWPQSRRAWKQYALALGGLTLPYLPMVLWHWEMLLSSSKRTLFNFVPLREVLSKVLYSHSRGPEHVSLGTFEDPLWLAPLFFLGLAGILLGVGEIEQSADANPAREPSAEHTENSVATEHPAAHTQPHLNQRRRFGILISWLLVPIALIYIISLRQPVFVDRYIIWIAPAAMMILALGMKAVWRNAAALALPLTCALLLYITLFWSYIGWQQKTTTNKYDLRNAVTFVAEQREPNELLILQIPHTMYSYRYYSSHLGTHPFDGSIERLGHWKEGLYTNRHNERPEAEVAVEIDEQMQQLIGDAKVVWVIYSEAQMWDRKRFMERWFERRTTTTESHDFYHAHVRKYEF